MTIELIFSLVTAIVTAILGTFTKGKVVPKKYIPLQNLIVGMTSSLVAINFNLFTDSGIAVFTCLAIAMGVGGTYDLVNAKK